MGSNFPTRFRWSLAIGAIFATGLLHGQALPAKSSEAVSAEASADAVHPIQPLQPVDNDTDITLDPGSLLPDLPPLPQGPATLIGGMVKRVDRVQDELTVNVFGGGETKIFFDPRTRIYRNGKLSSASELKPGERIYLDTILNGKMVFARNIRLNSSAAEGESQGVILSYNPSNGQLVLRDLLSPQPSRLRLTRESRIVQGDRVLSSNDLSEGTLVSVRFAAEPNGYDVAQEVSILAVRGANFTFAGTVTFLDLRAGLLVLTSDMNHKSYEIYLSPSVAIDENLRQGAEVTALAQFDGSHYVARSLTVAAPSQK